MDSYTAKAVLVEAPDFPARFKEHMDATRIGIRPLARESGVDKSTIVAWLKKAEAGNGQGSPILVYFEKARLVAPHLETTAEHLLGLPSAAAPSAEADLIALLGRIGAMKPAIAELDSPTHDLAVALAGSHERMVRLEAVLPQLLQLAEEAASMTER